MKSLSGNIYKKISCLTAGVTYLSLAIGHTFPPTCFLGVIFDDDRSTLLQRLNNFYFFHHRKSRYMNTKQMPLLTASGPSVVGFSTRPRQITTIGGQGSDFQCRHLPFVLHFPLNMFIILNLSTPQFVDFPKSRGSA